MCSVPIVKAAVRAGSAVMSFGSSEVLRKAAPSVNAYGAAENLAGKGAAGAGLKTGPDIQFPKPFSSSDASGHPPGTPIDPTVPTDPVQTEPPPTPGAPAPGATTVASLAARRKRLLALQNGITSTIATGPSGLTGLPTLASPVAGGLKLKLGA